MKSKKVDKYETGKQYDEVEIITAQKTNIK